MTDLEHKLAAALRWYLNNDTQPGNKHWDRHWMHGRIRAEEAYEEYRQAGQRERQQESR